MGHGGGQEPDILGDAPNVVSGVQSAAEPGSVLITAAVLELVSGLFVLLLKSAERGICAPPFNRRNELLATVSRS